MASFDEVKWTGQQRNPERLDTAFNKISRPVRYILIVALFGASSAVGDGKWAIGRIAAENIEDVGHVAFMGRDSLKTKRQAYDIGDRVIDAVVGAGLERNRAGGYETGLPDTTIDVYATGPQVVFSEITIVKDIQRPDSQFDSQYKVVVNMTGNSPEKLKTGEMGEDDINFIVLTETECSRATYDCTKVGYTGLYEEYDGRWDIEHEFGFFEQSPTDSHHVYIEKSNPVSVSLIDELLPPQH